MQETKKLYNNLFSQESLKNFTEKNNSQNDIVQKNFLNGLQNARTILNSLERSLQKTKKYEKELVKCRASHSHTHDLNEWWESDISDEKSKCCTGTSARNEVNLENLDSWSTMSIVCLQYQYEELSKRYSSLLQAYNERCSSLSSREATLARLRQRVRVTHASLAHAHRTLLLIGEKYLALRDKRLAQKSVYEAKVRRLKSAVHEVLAAAEKARADLDAQLASSMGEEKDAATALLLDEIRKCNSLYLENLRLKAQLEMFAPGNIK